jgi:putative chitinase
VNQSASVFTKLEINTPLRIAHFMAQISHESGGGTISVENLNYTTAARLMAVWPTRFRTAASAKPYVRNPIGLACKVYNGRMGNRAGSEDGWLYRGRGFLQLTGRESYQKIGRTCGLDLEGDPDLALLPEYELLIAATEFVHSGCLKFADKDDLKSVTKRVNGGYIGLDSRAAWLKKWKKEMK